MSANACFRQLLLALLQNCHPTVKRRYLSKKICTRYGTAWGFNVYRLGMHLDIGLLMHPDPRWAGSIPQFFKGVADHPWRMERTVLTRRAI